MYWCWVSSRPSATTALIPWWWIWDIPLRTLETEGSAYVSMIVADVLVPSKHQATTNHDTCDVMWITKFVLCYVHKNIFYGVGLPVTHQFLCITDGLGGGRVTRFPFGPLNVFVYILHSVARVNSQNRPHFEGDYRSWWLACALLDAIQLAASRDNMITYLCKIGTWYY